MKTIIVRVDIKLETSTLNRKTILSLLREMIFPGFSICTSDKGHMKVLGLKSFTIPELSQKED